MVFIKSKTKPKSRLRVTRAPGLCLTRSGTRQLRRSDQRGKTRPASNMKIETNNKIGKCKDLKGHVLYLAALTTEELISILL